MSDLPHPLYPESSPAASGSVMVSKAELEQVARLITSLQESLASVRDELLKGPISDEKRLEVAAAISLLVPQRKAVEDVNPWEHAYAGFDPMGSWDSD